MLVVAFNCTSIDIVRKWKDFDRDLFDEIYNDDSRERDFDGHIYGYDIDMKAVNTARLNVRAAGLTQDISIEQRDFKDFVHPENKSIIVTNPPYGERISTPDLLGTYRMIGERLKHEFYGNEAWILSYREECFDQIGLKPSIKTPLFNGSLECEFRKYALFSGKIKEFQSEGGVVRTDEERKAMAEKHRFKKNREFKRRLEEDAENAEADIRSFQFHSIQRDEERERRREERESRGFGHREERGGFGKREERNERGGRGGFGKRDDRGGRGGFGKRDDRGGRGGFGKDGRGGFGKDGRGGFGKDGRGSRAERQSDRARKFGKFREKRQYNDNHEDHEE